MGKSRPYCGRKREYPDSPPAESHLPYDEISHEVDNNFLSIKVAKNAGQPEQIAPSKPDPCDDKEIPIEIPSADEKGKKCARKVNVIPNKLPPPKRPDEEMLVLRTTKQITTSDEVRNSLEIRFCMARNYVPLPEEAPGTSILQIHPKEPVKKPKKAGKPKDDKKNKKPYDPCA